MKKIYFLITFLVFIALTLEAASISLSNQNATDSIEVSEMKNEIATLTEKNRHLRQELLHYTSIKNVASKAAELGFGQSTEFIYINEPDRIASR